MKTGSDADKTLRALGLCRKAGKLVCGTEQVCEALAGAVRPFLVIAASDNSPNTAKRLSDKCNFYGVRLVLSDSDGQTLAAAVGKSGRTAAVAVTDENLCRLVTGTLNDKQHF